LKKIHSLGGGDGRRLTTDDMMSQFFESRKSIPGTWSLPNVRQS
jgi:hypothetical protein